MSQVPVEPIRMDGGETNSSWLYNSWPDKDAEKVDKIYKKVQQGKSDTSTSDTSDDNGCIEYESDCYYDGCVEYDSDGDMVGFR